MTNQGFLSNSYQFFLNVSVGDSFKTSQLYNTDDVKVYPLPMSTPC